MNVKFIIRKYEVNFVYKIIAFLNLNTSNHRTTDRKIHLTMIKFKVSSYYDALK